MNLRILYVHGIRPKPPPDVHLATLRRCLAVGIARADPGFASAFPEALDSLRLVSWGHLFYPDYRDIALDEAAIGGLIGGAGADAAALRQVRSWRRRIVYAAHRLADRYPGLIERLATPDTRLNLAESARYFDQPDIAERVRALLAAELRRAWAAGERVLLMAHSFGSVIAWDTLWSLSRAGPASRPGSSLRPEASSRPGSSPGPIDLFLTLGSPLGTRFVRRRLIGADEEGADRFPRGIRQWKNFAARGGLTALGHEMASDYADMQRLGLVESIEDRTDLLNPFVAPDGFNVHKCYGYFVNPSVGAALAGWWRESAGRYPD